MFLLSAVISLLVVVGIAAKFNWDGFNNHKNSSVCFAITIVSFLLCMVSALFLAHRELDNINPNSPLSCLSGMGILVFSYISYKFGPPEPKRKTR